MNYYLIYYFVGINVLSLLLFFIDYRLYCNYSDKSIPNGFLTILVLGGGSLGALISFLILDRELNKQNLTWRIFTVAVLIIQVLLLLVLFGPHSQNFREAALNTWNRNMVLIVYLAIVNSVTFILFGIDKWKAVHNRWRIKILVLLGFCAIGGSIGGLLGMKVFHHKTHKSYFSFGVPLILLVQILVICYLKISNII